MKSLRFLVLAIIVFGVIPKTGVGGSLSDKTKLGLFLRMELEDVDGQDWVSYENAFTEHLNWLKQKKVNHKSDYSFLKLVFYRTHKRFLKKYEQYATFGRTISEEGAYDCVTGTALYALILDEFGFNYEIRETDYHAYLLVHAEGKTYLFESTDAIYGFVTSQKEIAERVERVLADAKKFNANLALGGVASNHTKDTDGEKNAMNNKVTLHQLAGLQFYNQALNAFRQEDYRKAYERIIIAQGIYPSQRIKHAASLMFSVAFSD